MWRTVAAAAAKSFCSRASRLYNNSHSVRCRSSWGLFYYSRRCYQADDRCAWRAYRFGSYGQQAIRYSSLILLICPVQSIAKSNSSVFFSPLFRTYFRHRLVIICMYVHIEYVAFKFSYRLLTLRIVERIIFNYTLAKEFVSFFLISAFDELLRLNSEIDFVLIYTSHIS